MKYKRLNTTGINGEERRWETSSWLMGKLGVRGKADREWPWESRAWLLSDIQDSWVGTLAESAPGGCGAGKAAKFFPSALQDVTSHSETCR